MRYIYLFISVFLSAFLHVPLMFIHLGKIAIRWTLFFLYLFLIQFQAKNPLNLLLCLTLQLHFLHYEPHVIIFSSISFSKLLSGSHLFNQPSNITSNRTLQSLNILTEFFLILYRFINIFD